MCGHVPTMHLGNQLIAYNTMPCRAMTCHAMPCRTISYTSASLASTAAEFSGASQEFSSLGLERSCGAFRTQVALSICWVDASSVAMRRPSPSPLSNGSSRKRRWLDVKQQLGTRPVSSYRGDRLGSTDDG